MYKNFTLTESERESILNQHMDHGYKQPINEQVKQPTGDFTTIGRFGTSDAKHFEKRGFTVKGGVAILKHPNPKLVITVKPSQKGWAAYQGGVLKFDLPHDDCDVELDKLIRINSLQGGNKIGIKEQISIPDAVQLGSKAYNYIKSKISPNPEPQKTSGIPKFTPGQEMKIVNNIYCNYLNSIDGAAVLENINPFSGSATVISDDGITLKLKVSFIGLDIKGKAQTFKDTCVNIKKEDISDWNKEYNMLNINISNEMFSWDLGHSKC